MSVTSGPGITYGGGGPTDGEYGGGGVYGGVVTQTLQFFDETGINPLPAGIYVSIFPANQLLFPSLTPLATGWTEPLGLCNAVVDDGVEVTAYFSRSFQAPTSSVTFTPEGGSGAVPVTVPGYRSPSLSQVGYDLLQMSKLPNLWFGDTAMQPGGIAYAIGYGYGAGMAALDLQTQEILAMMRLQYCTNGDIDSWSNDMVGPTFGRYSSGGVTESDANFIARNMVMVVRPRTTIASIQAMVEAFYNSIAGEPGSIAGEGQLAFGVAGATNVAGGLNVSPPISPAPPIVVPPIFVWDGMTHPELASAYDLQPGYFVIQIGNVAASLAQVAAFNVSGAYNISGAFNVVPSDETLPPLSAGAPDPRLALLVNLLAKAGGTVPMYLIGAPY